MQRQIQHLIILIAVTGLSACSMPPREGPPAPVVQVTPRETPASQPPMPEPTREAPTEAQPAKPARPETRVYAYRDPSAQPDPAPAPTAQPATPTVTQSAPGATAAPAQPATSASGPAARDGQQTEPTRPAAPAPARQSAEQQVAKADVQPPARPEPPPIQAKPLPPSNFAAPKLPPAAETLAAQAEQQRQSGDYAGAAASLERSLRIAPREAYLWNRLARVRMEQGQASQAGNLASRSNDLAGDKGDIKKDNWRIIAESKRRAGDVAGASEAEQRAGRD